MTNLLAALLLSIVPHDSVVRDHVDLVERNWFYDEQGRLVFQQNIFYDWSWKDGRYQVVAWRLVKVPEQAMIRDWSGTGYRAMWMDGDTLRCVTSGSVRETWEQTDPELVEREYLPKEKRRELKRSR